MAYIGKALVGILNENKVVDSMTGDGSDTTLTLSRTPGSVNNVEVFIDGIYQTPDVEYTLAGDTITFTTAPELNVTVVAVSGADSTIINPAAGSITGAKIVDNAITGAKVAALSASKLTGALPALSGSGLTGLPAANLTGALPALDGSALTGLPAANLTGALPAIDGSALTGVSGVTKSASDPLITTNPSGGVGQLFLNTTSGEMYACTDATTDNNVWTNVGPGTGNIIPWAFTDGGAISVYTTGGWKTGGALTDKIEKISVTADGNSIDISNLTAASHGWGGISSSTHGYTNAGGNGMGGTTVHNRIEKFQFSNDGDASDIADMTVSMYNRSGHSMATHGYSCGGQSGSAATSVNVIDRFPLATDSDATDVGDLDAIRCLIASSSSTDYGYCAGGESTPAPINVIQRFQFVASANSSDVGDLINSTATPGGHTYSTHGYVTGGQTNIIQKYAFASSGNATDLADLTWAVFHGQGSESTTHGYCMGGYAPNNTIQKFAFVSTVNATDVGDLSEPKAATGTAHN